MVGAAGDPAFKTGLRIMIFTTDRSMPERTAFYSADFEFLIVLQHGVLDIQTEFGNLLIRPNELGVIPRGTEYRVNLPEGPVRGYILKYILATFVLGPIGSNGLANARGFQALTAAFEEDADSQWTIFCKYNNDFFSASKNHTPFDVVGWHGVSYPYEYNLGQFNVISSTSFPDPGICTMLMAPTADFVIFPPR